MRVSISKGYQSYIEELMGRLKTDDPKLAVEHIIGCWIAAMDLPTQAIAPTLTTGASQAPLLTGDELDSLADWG